ncbi:MAG: hypothetical protein ACD_2C00092G0003 [uncultured bacterium (gcode 4)]|uniref:Uncharacterized protein n=1 Tax=uncultured bacterium (gcode 4) TaxID=1234023 RepID=K2H1T7_9BACT|nr:MAG: hypothetical protein ACD_2C00092G0003 [uncultured bacterium (gcode 4)]
MQKYQSIWQKRLYRYKSSNYLWSSRNFTFAISKLLVAMSLVTPGCY